jgi:hypothetical protein
MSALYVIAFTNEPAPPVYLADRRIEFIECSGIHVAVERLADPPSLSEAALRAQHDIVMKIAESVEAIVPARFGALLDRQELESLVSMRLDPIRKTLEHVRGRVQMTVRAFGTARSAAASRMKNQHKRETGTAYLQQRRASATPLPEEAAAVRRAVRGLLHDERTHPGSGRVGWTLYHLVDRTAVPDYIRAVEPFRSSAIVVSGPWPPFAFVPDLWP